MNYSFTVYTQDEAEMFSPDAFDSSIGKEVMVTVNDVSTAAVVLGAKVASNGCFATILVEIPDESDAAKVIRGEFNGTDGASTDGDYQDEERLRTIRFCG